MFQSDYDAVTSKFHQKNETSRVEWVLRDIPFSPHQSIDGSRGYDIPLCQMMLEAYKSGRPAPPRKLRSIQHCVNSPIPFQLTGNKSNCELSGHYLMLLDFRDHIEFDKWQSLVWQACRTACRKASIWANLPQIIAPFHHTKQSVSQPKKVWLWCSVHRRVQFVMP